MHSMFEWHIAAINALANQWFVFIRFNCILGDGRNDSPGHSAQYCTYTVMEHGTDRILALQTVDKREVERKSPNMEGPGCWSSRLYCSVAFGDPMFALSNGIKCITFFTAKNMKINYDTTVENEFMPFSSWWDGCMKPWHCVYFRVLHKAVMSCYKMYLFPTGESPTPRTSYAENVSIWWRHHGDFLPCTSL